MTKSIAYLSFFVLSNDKQRKELIIYQEIFLTK